MGAHQPARFKQNDVTKVMKSARDAGIRDFSLTIDPLGNIVFSTTKETAGKINSMDKLLGR